MIKIISKQFQLSYDWGIFPDSWIITRVTPIESLNGELLNGCSSELLFDTQIFINKLFLSGKLVDGKFSNSIPGFEKEFNFYLIIHHF